MSKVATVIDIPTCSYCGKPAVYDAKLQFGPWAYVCEEHFQLFGIGLGTGKGQKLEVTQSYNDMAEYLDSHCNEEAL